MELRVLNSTSLPINVVGRGTVGDYVQNPQCNGESNCYRLQQCIDIRLHLNVTRDLEHLVVECCIPALLGNQTDFCTHKAKRLCDSASGEKESDGTVTTVEEPTSKASYLLNFGVHVHVMVTFIVLLLL